ncbi:sulfurtransferase [Halomonas sp. V046]|uniref:sulfurtransferase n=1 Tax=Halomonas sp. V046 TaxID=3459611 RepID=UPI00404466D4
MTHPLITAKALDEALSGVTPPVILDCRVRLTDPGAGKQLWREGHVPGSQHLDLDRDLSGATASGGGRHPLPARDAFRDTLQRLGLSPDRPIVVLDDMGGQLAAARAWWMLSHWAGHPEVQLLDGGLAAWEALGGEWEVGDGADVTPSRWQPVFDDSGLVGLEEMATSAALKVDARASERFRGDSEPLDPRAGHIPGAVNRPCSENLDEQGLFKSSQQLAAELPHAEAVIAYCGSGVTACHDLLAYQLAGRALPRLYVGSWSEWSADPQRPAATGAAG